MNSPDFRKTCQKILTQGRQILDLEMGIVSHIHDNLYDIIAVDSQTGVFQSGESFALNDTFCRDVYNTGNTIALTELGGITGLQKHPLYPVLGLEAYISTPIIRDDKVWGTLNFSSMLLRDHLFTANEVILVESYAKRLSLLLGYEVAA